MADGASATALTFHETTFEIVEHSAGEQWLRGSQVGSALGYEDPARSIGQLYDRYDAEFTPAMTDLVKLPTAGGLQEVRIFSLRGAHLLGMFARTDRAAEFRRWVLDVLEHQVQPAPVAAPVLIGQTFERVVAERDALRAMLAERVLREEPKLRKVIYYYQLPGLTHRERALLMGWKSQGTFIEALKRLAALGLVDYQPEQRRVTSALKNLVPTVLQRHADRPARLPPKPRERYGNLHDDAHMEKMRVGKAAKRAARKEGGK